MTNLAPSSAEIIAAAIFAVALAHTFLTKFFAHLAHIQPAHAGLWHLLGEVEVVFGFWAIVLISVLFLHAGQDAALHYVDKRSFTEPMFVFVIMVIAASRPILLTVLEAVQGIARVLPLNRAVSVYFLCLAGLPLLGSFITEPAAMTLAALMLRDAYFSKRLSQPLLYATLGVLFVNVSIGGTLTHFAAPPVLMVAAKWQWDSAYMLANFGWKAAIAVFLNAAIITFMFRRELVAKCSTSPSVVLSGDVPRAVTFVHLLLLTGVVVFAHHPVIFMGIFLLFLGFAEAYKRHQDPLILREGLLVAFFLAGLVTLGGLQTWWLQPALTGVDSDVLYYLATALTAITDNAALTYLGSLVEGLPTEYKHALVAGAVTGGGLTVIANAPNPAGYSILKDCFPDGAISPLGLFAAALVPTCMAMAAFRLL